MIVKIKDKIKGDELLRGSLILLIMIGIFNILNHIFHFSMARLLGPEDYGVLAVLFSLIYIFSIPSESIQSIMASYTSKFSLNKEYGKIKFMFLKGLKKSFIFSFPLFIVSLLFTLFLSYFLKIDYLLFVVTSFLIFLFLSISILRGILQGQKKFISFGTNMIVEGFVKVVLGVLLVILGLKVYGSILAVILALTVSFFLAFLFIGDILRVKEERENFKMIYFNSLPYFISMLSIVLMYTLDIILAKRFFSPESVGRYSVASTLGKVIFFGIFAVSKAMFPITSENYYSGRETMHLFKKSLKISLLISGGILFLYLFFPKEIINILFGKQYLEAAQIVFIIGLSLTLLSFTNITILYGLSVNKVKNSSYSLFIFVLLEILLLSLFHSSILQFSIFFLMVNFLMFIYSIFLIIK